MLHICPKHSLGACVQGQAMHQALIAAKMQHTVAMQGSRGALESCRKWLLLFLLSCRSIPLLPLQEKCSSISKCSPLAPWWGYYGVYGRSCCAPAMQLFVAALQKCSHPHRGSRESAGGAEQTDPDPQ